MTYILIGTLLVLVPVIFFLFNAIKEDRSNLDQIEPIAIEEAYIGIRNMAMNFKAEDIGIEMKGDMEIYGIIMDWNLEDVAATLTAFKSGESSLYLSRGGGVLGGGEHQNVRTAVYKYIKLGEEYLDKSIKTEETPLPESDIVNFYFLTKSGKYLKKEKMPDLKNQVSEWYLLFEEANQVLTQLRLVSMFPGQNIHIVNPPSKNY